VSQADGISYTTKQEMIADIFRDTTIKSVMKVFKNIYPMSFAGDISKVKNDISKYYGLKIRRSQLNTYFTVAKPSAQG